MRHAIAVLGVAALMGCAADMPHSTLLEDASRAPAPAAGEAPAAEKPAIAPAALVEPGSPEFAALAIDDAMLSVIKGSEGLKLAAYQGPAGSWLIGYGHKRTAKAGMTITEAEADALPRRDLKTVEDVVRRSLTKPVSQREFSAMVDLAYNIGTGSFRKSSVLRAFNAGDRQGAADAFLLWNKMTVGGKRVENPHLTERRRLERAHFLGVTET